MSTIHLASAVNQKYLLPLAVQLDSLKQQLTAEVDVVVHLLHVDLKEEHLKPLRQLFEICAIQIDDASLTSIPHDSRFPPEAAFPLLLADVLPTELERVLFLDADMLIFDDVSSLWETPMGDYVLAAAPDTAIPLCSSPRAVKGWREAGIPQDEKYFNGGVLLINMVLWRERDVARRAYEYLQRNRGNVDFLHQEALNSVLWNQRMMLDERWNVLGSRAGRAFDDSVSKAWKKPGIVHFSGRMKPWRYPIAGPFQKPYELAMQRVSSLYPVKRATVKERLQGQYDLYLRDFVYPVEEFLWRHRWL